LSSTEWPRIASDDAIMVVGSARPMEVTARIGNTELVLWLEQEYCYDRWDACQLLTQADGLYVGNMADTTYSLVASVDKKLYSDVHEFSVLDRPGPFDFQLG
jgi:hypothetical protein